MSSLISKNYLVQQSGLASGWTQLRRSVFHRGRLLSGKNRPLGQELRTRSLKTNSLALCVLYTFLLGAPVKVGGTSGPLSNSAVFMCSTMIMCPIKGTRARGLPSLRRPQRRPGRGRRRHKLVLCNCISCFKRTLASLADVLIIMSIRRGWRAAGRGRGRGKEGGRARVSYVARGSRLPPAVPSHCRCGRAAAVVAASAALLTL